MGLLSQDRVVHRFASCLEVAKVPYFISMKLPLFMDNEFLGRGILEDFKMSEVLHLSIEKQGCCSF